MRSFIRDQGTVWMGFGNPSTPMYLSRISLVQQCRVHALGGKLLPHSQCIDVKKEVNRQKTRSRTCLLSKSAQGRRAYSYGRTDVGRSDEDDQTHSKNEFQI
jgi:hypothetical protein